MGQIVVQCIEYQSLFASIWYFLIGQGLPWPDICPDDGSAHKREGVEKFRTKRDIGECFFSSTVSCAKLDPNTCKEREYLYFMFG